jgi:hypothetical protein
MILPSLIDKSCMPTFVLDRNEGCIYNARRTYEQILGVLALGRYVAQPGIQSRLLVHHL